MAEWDLICVHGCVKIYDYWFSRLLKIFCWHLFFFFFLSWVCLFFLFYNVYVIKTHFQIIFMFPFLWNFSVIFFLHIFAIYFIYLWLFYRLKIINLKKNRKTSDIPFERVSHSIENFHFSNKNKMTFNTVSTSLVGMVLNSILIIN